MQRETVLAALPDGSHQSVLEIGGGHGQLAAPLASAGYHVTVFGSSAACRERVGSGSHNNPIYFVSGDILHLPFPDNSFDIVVSVRLLSHMENWRGLISEMCRVARHTVILDFPSLTSINVLSLGTFGLKRRIEGNTRRYRSFLETSLRREFGRHFFRKEGAWRQFTLPMAVHRLLKGARWLERAEEFMRKIGLTGVIGSPVILRMDWADETPQPCPAPSIGD